MCAIGFAVLFNVPKKSVTKAGIAGGVGWLIHFTMTEVGASTVIATFLGSLGIAILGEIFAVFDKEPVTLYIIPGIIPLVPGFGIYYTMLSLVEQNYEKALEQGLEAMLIAILIAAALTIVLSVNNFRKKRRERSLF